MGHTKCKGTVASPVQKLRAWSVCCLGQGLSLPMFGANLATELQQSLVQAGKVVWLCCPLWCCGTVCRGCCQMDVYVGLILGGVCCWVTVLGIVRCFGVNMHISHTIAISNIQAFQMSNPIGPWCSECYERICRFNSSMNCDPHGTVGNQARESDSSLLQWNWSPYTRCGNHLHVS